MLCATPRSGAPADRAARRRARRRHGRPLGQTSPRPDLDSNYYSSCRLPALPMRSGRSARGAAGMSSITPQGDEAPERAGLPDPQRRGQWVWRNSLLAGYPFTELPPAAVRTLFPRAKTVFRRQVPPDPVPILKNPSFDLITRAAFIAQVPAEPKQSTTRRDARRIGHFVGPLRSAVRPRTTTAPALRPGHKLRAVRCAAPGRCQTEKRERRSRCRRPGCRIFRPTQRPATTAPPAAISFNHDPSQQPQARSRRISTGCPSQSLA